jgi:hypothetical protein
MIAFSASLHLERGFIAIASEARDGLHGNDMNDPREDPCDRKSRGRIAMTVISPQTLNPTLCFQVILAPQSICMRGSSGAAIVARE